MADTSQELVPSPRRVGLEELHARDRRAALERLQAEAETADADRAHEIMVQGKTVAALLQQIRAPFEDAQLAGKASVTAARRVGEILNETSNRVLALPERRGTAPSARGVLASELGLGRTMTGNLLRLGRVPDPEFQRYIQRADVIPSLNGALAACSIVAARTGRPSEAWSPKRRKKHRVQPATHPSVKTAYSEIRLALGHLSGTGGDGGGAPRRRAIGRAMDLLYEAADQLIPYV